VWGCRLPRDEPAALKTSTEASAARRTVACQAQQPESAVTAPLVSLLSVCFRWQSACSAEAHGAAATRACAPCAGFNSGVMLFRRSKWTKEFLEAVAELGRVPEPRLGEVPAPLCLNSDSCLSCDAGCATQRPTRPQLTCPCRAGSANAGSSCHLRALQRGWQPGHWGGTRRRARGGNAGARRPRRSCGRS